MNRFSDVWDSANICPLGSGAIAGTTLPIDRLYVAEKLETLLMMMVVQSLRRIVWML